MKQLPKRIGLLEMIAGKLAEAGREEVKARSQTICPRSAYEAGEVAARLRREAEALVIELRGAVYVIGEIEKLIAWLGGRGEVIDRRGRVLADTARRRGRVVECLEAASDGLRREIGDGPEEARI